MAVNVMYIDEVIYIGQLLHNTCMVIELGANLCCKNKVKASHTHYRALGPELIPVCRQSACR